MLGTSHCAPKMDVKNLGESTVGQAKMYQTPSNFSHAFYKHNNFN
jgi:hypothetical protein